MINQVFKPFKNDSELVLGFTSVFKFEVMVKIIFYPEFRNIIIVKVKVRFNYYIGNILNFNTQNNQFY